MEKKDRLLEFDIAKGIAILCVILGHLGIKEISRVVFVFHMPLFFLISGYFLSQKDTFECFKIKKFKQLIIPYIATCVAICLLSIPVSIVLEQNIGQNLFKWICGSIYGSGTRPGIIPGFPSFIGALWFLEALFWGALITRYVIDNWSDNIAPVMILIISYVGYFTALKSWLPFNIQAGCTAAGFIYLGFLFKKHSAESLPLPVILFLLFNTAWCIKYFKGFWLVQNYFGNGWMDVIGALSASCLIILFSKKVILKCGTISNILQWYGRNSLIVLAFHIIELDLIPRVKALRYIESFGFSATMAIVILVLCKILWATAGVIFVNHVPVLKKLYSGKW